MHGGGFNIVEKCDGEVLDVVSEIIYEVLYCVTAYVGRAAYHEVGSGGVYDVIGQDWGKCMVGVPKV